MIASPELTLARDALRFTPGPVTTSQTVRQAMLHVLGPRHEDLADLVARIRDGLLRMAGLGRTHGWEVVLHPGTAAVGIESVFQTTVPLGGKVAVLVNGSAGLRMVRILERARIECVVLHPGDGMAIDPIAVDACLSDEPQVTHVAVAHCEPSTGLVNPVEAIGRVVARHEKVYVVDAVTSFGGMPFDFAHAGAHFVVSMPDRGLEGMPGFSIVFAPRARMWEGERRARSASLDLVAHWRSLEPGGEGLDELPLPALLAGEQALIELRNEGGTTGRAQRYRRNHETLLAGMRRLGFVPLLDPALQSSLVTAFRYPVTGFDFATFARKLSERGLLIAPGDWPGQETFRIASMGRIFPADVELLLSAVERVMRDMNLLRPAPVNARPAAGVSA